MVGDETGALEANEAVFSLEDLRHELGGPRQYQLLLKSSVSTDATGTARGRIKLVHERNVETSVRKLRNKHRRMPEAK